MKWNQDAVDELTKQYAEGKTNAEIAKDMQLSQAQVSAKLQQLRVKGVVSPRYAPRALILANIAKHQEYLENNVTTLALNIPVGDQNLRWPDGTLMDNTSEYDLRIGEGLTRHRCAWPCGDPKEPGFFFCGKPSQGRYCEVHEARAVKPWVRVR